MPRIFLNSYVIQERQYGTNLDKIRIAIIPDTAPSPDSHPVIGRIELVRYCA